MLLAYFQNKQSSANMRVSKTQQAAAAFKEGDYAKSLSLYENLNKKYKNDLFAANIELCNRRLKPPEGIPKHSEPPANQSITQKKHFFFPKTNNKLRSYVAETVVQSAGSLASLGRLKAAHGEASSAFLEGMLDGLKLLKIIDRAPTLLVAGHDLRFLQPFIEYFKSHFNLLIDQWSATNKHDRTRSEELLSKADIIWCEWCCGNAVWYSNNVKKNQKIIVRLHRFEIETQFPSKVSWENVESIIFIAKGIRDAVNERHKITCKQHVLFNGFDVDKASNAFQGTRDRLALAVVGYVPYLKRLDIALDFYEKALSYDKNISLHMKGKSAESIPWVWSKEQKYFETQDERIERLIADGGRITKAPYDEAVHKWLGSKGFLLSTSDIEGSHQAVAEAMACGTIPLIFGNWVTTYKARLMYPNEFCFSDLCSALKYMQMLLSDPEEYERTSNRARAFAHENFNERSILHGALRIIDNCDPALPYVPIESRKKIIIFSDLCINVIDGSSIWLMSLVELLLSDSSTSVVLISKEKNKKQDQFSRLEKTGRFQLEEFPGVFAEATLNSYLEFFSKAMEKHRPSKAIVRCAPDIANRLPGILGAEKISKLIFYVIGERYPSDLLLCGVSSIFVQTEEALDRLQIRFPSIVESKKIRILRPMIPDDFKGELAIPKNKLIVGYSGKLCKAYAAKEMLDFILSAEHNVELVICSAKIHRQDGDDYIKTLKKSISAAVQSGKAIIFEGLDRFSVSEIIKATHVGWSIRGNEFLDSSEISTKVLEYCSLGKPVLLNKHPSNVVLLGEDYPLYCGTHLEAAEKLAMLKADSDLYTELSSFCRERAEKYRMTQVYRGISDVL